MESNRRKKLRSDSFEENYVDYRHYYSHKGLTQQLHKLVCAKLKSIATIYYDQNRYIAKKCKNIKKTGTKPELISHILFWVNLNKQIEIIQKNFRRHLVKKWFELRGPALMNRTLCVNDSDFCTLEPLDEIDSGDFFSYDEKGYIYGFDLKSLWTMYKKKGIILNSLCTNKLSIFNTKNQNLKIIKQMKNEANYNKNILERNKIKNPYVQNIITHDSPLYKNVIDLYFIKYTLIPHINTLPITPTRINSVASNSSRNVPFLLALEEHIAEIRALPILQRIVQLFMEIDYLENYTQSQWFTQLTKRQLYLLFCYLKDIWVYGGVFNANGNITGHGLISQETKQNICTLGSSPFYNIEISVTPLFTEDSKTFEEIQNLTLTVMENLVYLGIDIEHKKLGALICLSALILVSHEARLQFNWLYEIYNL